MKATTTTTTSNSSSGSGGGSSTTSSKKKEQQQQRKKITLEFEFLFLSACRFIELGRSLRNVGRSIGTFLFSQPGEERHSTSLEGS